MTRFDADTPEERRALVTEAVAAHRERGSRFVTLEAAENRSREGSVPEAFAAEGDEEAEWAPPWVQYADGTLNLDCTAAELDRLKTLLDAYPAFTIEELTEPEDLPGTNVRVAARADDERLAAFVDDLFREAYDQPGDYVLWVTEL